MGSPGTFIDGGAVTIVAAADSSIKSRLPIQATFVTVSAVVTNADDWVILPTGVKTGHVIHGWSAIAHEMRTEASSGIEINSEDGDGTKEAAIPATTLWRATYIDATIGWILNAWDELAAPITAIVPD